MTTITIPKKLNKNEDLVAIPRKEYKKLLRLRNLRIKELDPDLKEALANIRAGRVIGPFDNAGDLIKSLKR